MTEAPERIWTTGNDQTGSWNSERVAVSGLEEIEYVRADIVGDLIKALKWVDDNAAFAHRKNIKAVSEIALGRLSQKFHR